MDAQTGLIAVNGKYLPFPKKDGYKVDSTTFVNSGRNANGTVIGEVIGREQYKITLEWVWLSASDWSEMCTEFEKFYVDVTFPNPTTNAIQTIKMYVGDRSATPYWLNNDYSNFDTYASCTCNLIDVGIQ